MTASIAPTLEGPENPSCEAGDVEIRSSELVGVSYPNRTVELVVMPYERPAQVAYMGRMVTEVCSRGAYDGVQERTSRIRVNRDHDRGKTVGKTVALHPSRQDGLVAEIRISRTELGEETLVLADDGVLDASAGFALMRGKDGRTVANAETWEARDRRRLNHLFLDHIALTPDPAYVDARVLAVRQAVAAETTVAPATTPNRDRLEYESFVRLRDVIDLRYGLKR